jgi:Zn-dependent protease
VPVNFARLRHPKRDMLWVAAAGPGSNLVMALLWGLAYKFSAGFSEAISLPLSLMAEAGVTINVVLLVLNLLPLPPLDGGRIAVSLLPHALAWKFAQLERYGFIILLVLMFSGILGKILGPPIGAMINLISWLVS